MRWVRREGGFLRLCGSRHLLIVSPSTYFSTYQRKENNNNNNNNTTTTTTTTTNNNINNKYVYAPRYAIRTSQRVRTPSYIHTYCTGDHLVLLHTLYSRTYVVRGTSWYQHEIPVPSWNSPIQLEDIPTRSPLVLYFCSYVALEEGKKNMSHWSVSLSRDGAYIPIPGDAGRLVPA